MVPSIHGARVEGERVYGGPFAPELALLHFHAENPVRWKAGLSFRLSKGAYRFLPALQAHLLAADDEAIAAFYDTVQTATPQMLDALSELGLLREVRLGLREKVAALGR